MFTRNLHQNLALHPDKLDFLKALVSGVRGSGFYSDPVRSIGRHAYTEAFVLQGQAVKKEQFMIGYMGKTPVERFIAKTDYYHLSDDLNRWASMAASGGKAERALEAFRKDGDVAKFMRNSGMYELSQTEQINILELLARDKYDYGGVLKSVSGGEQAIRDIANKITTRVHLNYIRFLRSSLEFGEAGRVLGSLVAFPRGVMERNIMVLNRLRPGSGISGAQRRKLWHTVASVIIGSIMANELYKNITGKRNNPYNPLELLTWQVGGLATGAAAEVTDVFRLIISALMTDDENQRSFFLTELTAKIPALGDMFIPFYIATMNILETMKGERNIDRKAVRQIREMFDENYELNEEFYKKERTILEKFQHALFGSDPPDPTKIESAMKELPLEIEKLGKVDEEAKQRELALAETENDIIKVGEKDFTYTTSDLGSAIWGVTKDIDVGLLTEDNFPPIVMEYWLAQPGIELYYDQMADNRYQFRADHPEIDADLIIWRGLTSFQSEEAESLVRAFIARYSIPEQAVPIFRKETKQPEVPDEGIPSIRGYSKRKRDKTEQPAIPSIRGYSKR